MFSRSVVTLVPVSFTVSGWLLPLLAMGLLPEAVFGQNIYNFSLAPGQSQTLLAAPGDNSELTVDVVWDDVRVMTVMAQIDGAVYIPDITQARASSKGSATVVVNTMRLAEGR